MFVFAPTAPPPVTGTQQALDSYLLCGYIFIHVTATSELLPVRRRGVPQGGGVREAFKGQVGFGLVLGGGRSGK